MDTERGLPNAVLFKIDAERCDLCVGDRVAPGTAIGHDYATSDALEAKHEGIVDAINPCSEDHALFVWISPRRHQ